ncbi:GNAT family N-acetyltransferase [Mycobacterium sp. 852014-52144_SCH5372336]|uniref:N-acetylglutamate synthase, CG3035 family n=1 Tax=Mycobacterium sp. 852014-52144_SCH5372336 TaxID=1834115 RepID=UPI0007FC209B|nr:GNAT family N-acetyltransferase [Mycobacterium sp. 852014-52144_SCH5372336]OBB72174.1 GCN5 family acetyltransferase [Mycobacterium sp. 852014-52144_SCH5372336]
MPALPAIGTRVTVRYRRPAGSTPPLTDVVGHVVDNGAALRIRTKRGVVVRVDLGDVVAIKKLPAAPVRTADIRNVEHAAALAWPGVDQKWLGGWLLRASGGHTHRGNSAVPLGFDADATAIPTIISWYGERGLTPWLSIPDRLFRLIAKSPHLETEVLTSDLSDTVVDERVTLTTTPDAAWLHLYRRAVPVDVLTAVIDGEVAFATIPGAAVGRAAVTTAPCGRRWVGLSAVRVDERARGAGLARALCSTLLGWGAQRGATGGYAQVLVDNAVALGLYRSMGFQKQHRSRYVDARSL